MNKTTAAAPAPRTIASARENAREAFMDAVARFLQNTGRGIEREKLVEILRNRDCRHILATCANEEAVIEAFTVIKDVELLQAFHNIGMKVDVKNQFGYHALGNASRDGHDDCVRWLLDHNANVEVQNNVGSTPLIFASHKGNTKIVEMLLQKNANPDIQNNFGWTALMEASYNDHDEIVRLLLNYNANIALKNKEGKTAHDFAKNGGINQMLRNHATRSKHLLVATNKGIIKAQNALGDCYHFGHGVSIDLDEAEKFYKLAADQKFQPAIASLKDLQEQREHVTKRLRTELPHSFFCPITHEIMKDPVICMDGSSYERTAIEDWLKRSDHSPMTNLPLPSKHIVPNLNLKQSIQQLVDTIHQEPLYP